MSDLETGHDAVLTCIAMPTGVTIDGLDDRGQHHLEIGEATDQVVIGRSSACDIQISGTAIGGLKNCSVHFAEGAWRLFHMGHSLPIIINGRESLQRGSYRLVDGDTFQPAAAGTPGPTFQFRLQRGPGDAIIDDLGDEDLLDLVPYSTRPTPESDKPFDAICPFCGSPAEELPPTICYNHECACGAIALGAPLRDFDEVEDAARHHFRLRPVHGWTGHPEEWREIFGVAFERGGHAGESPAGPSYHFWFKRVRL